MMRPPLVISEAIVVWAAVRLNCPSERWCLSFG